MWTLLDWYRCRLAGDFVDGLELDDTVGQVDAGSDGASDFTGCCLQESYDFVCDGLVGDSGDVERVGALFVGGADCGDERVGLRCTCRQRRG